VGGVRITPQRNALRLADALADVTGGPVAGLVDFTILQLNDFYDVMPVEGGRRGGAARVATLRRQLAQENPNLLVVLAGDFLAPSSIGAITGDSGMHMIEALNAMGLTHATMGNHEFDVGEAELRQRIAESRFRWVVSNVKDGHGRPFDGVDERAVITFANGRGDAVRVALIGLCIDLVKAPWLSYEDPIESARHEVAALADQADVIVALTHLSMPEDRRLGESVPRIDVLLGGHEHEAARACVGADLTPIFKADSNARSAFVHRFRFAPETGVTLLFSEIVQLDARFAEEPETAAIVDRWRQLTFATLRAQGNDPLTVVGATSEALEGSEAELRSGPTTLGQLVAEAFLAEVPGADGLLLPAGLLRLDGVLGPGTIFYFDIVRIFPLGGALSALRLQGELLRELLDAGAASTGTGGFLILANISRADLHGWTIAGAPLLDDAQYTIVCPKLPASHLAHPPFKGRATKLHDTRDMRTILADRLRRDLPQP
jgi:5'-nucleotidase/UDP-sugar diphosphatase